MKPVMRDPPAFYDPADYGRARHFFRETGFTPSGAAATVGRCGLEHLHDRDVPTFLRRTAAGRPLDTLIRLFYLAVEVDEAAARRSLGPMRLERWTDAGLLAADRGSVRAVVKLVPFGDHWFASDRPQSVARGARADHVMGVGPATAALARVTVRRHVRAALDMGTGCGALAVLAAGHCDTVTGVDLNARAVGFARFNALLNGLDNVEAIEGDLFEPVASRRFGLIVSDPPFVISPGERYVYRDGGMQGDAFSRRLLREAPGLLEEGGYCQVLCDWVHTRAEDGRARVESWFEGLGCDAWVMCADTSDPSSYAATWIATTEPSGPSERARLYDEWMDYYEREGIEAISGGFITLRRRSGPNWFRYDEIPADISAPVGDDIDRCFRLRDWLDGSAGDADLSVAKLRLDPDVRLEHACRAVEGGWRTETIEVCRARGLPFRGRVNAPFADLLARADGRRPLRDLIADLAASVGGDPGTLTPDVHRLVRTMIANGFLLPEGFGRDRQGEAFVEPR